MKDLEISDKETGEKFIIVDRFEEKHITYYLVIDKQLQFKKILLRTLINRYSVNRYPKKRIID